MLQSRIRRGEMDRKIIIIKKDIGTNVFNEDKTDSWSAVAVNPTVWAKKKDLKGKEVVIADRIEYVQQCIFTIDFRTDIKEVNYRIVFNEKPYDIISVIPNEESRDRYLDCVCQIVDNEVWT